jgi:hypothetical protein
MDSDNELGLGLLGLQALLYRLITAPNGVAGAVAAEASLKTSGLSGVIAAGERMSAVERAGIYANAYFFRLLEVCKEDFQATLSVIGEKEFHNLITGYLLAFPPTEPSVLYVGQHLASYIASSPFGVRWPFLADLARLERLLIESFHAADAAPLGLAAMRAIAPGDWPGVEMRLHPATRLLETRWRIDQVLSAAERRDSSPVPEASPATLLVWRRDARVFYRAIEPAEAEALRLAASGAIFGAICEVIAASATGVESPDLIGRLLSRWLGDGLLLAPAK